MSRHAKNNTAAAHFTAAERRKAGYGTKRARYGRDSVRAFDACCLCLETVRDPVACPDGCLFCKECIYTAFVQQKRDIEAEMAQYERDVAVAAAAEAAAAREAGAAAAASFTRVADGVIGGVGSTHTAMRVGEVVTGDAKARIVREESDRAARESALSELKKDVVLLDNEDRRRSMPSYWTVDKTPSAAPAAPVKPTTRTKCPESGRPLKTKQLIAVHMTPCHDEGGGGGGGGAAASTGRTVAVDTTDGRFMCPACRRTLAHQPAALLSKCGHVLCDACVEQFVVPGKACLACGAAYEKGDKVPLKAGGTGFAAHNKVTSETYCSAGI